MINQTLERKMAIDFVGTQISILTSWISSWFQSYPKQEKVQTNSDFKSSTATPSASLFNLIFSPSTQSNQHPSPKISKNLKTKHITKSKGNTPTNQTYISQIVNSVSCLFSWIFYPLQFLHVKQSLSSRLCRQSDNHIFEMFSDQEEDILFDKSSIKRKSI